MAPSDKQNLDQIVDGWSSQSWRLKTVHAQEVDYSDKSALETVCRTLERLPPLVSPAQIEEARELFASAARGEGFIIQGGDCAESFEDIKLDIIDSKTSLLQEQANVIESNLLLPVTCVGRIAGQYAKPRSNPTEILADGTAVCAFRGHNINGTSLDERDPDPNRLLQGYFYSAVTLNTISGIGDNNSTSTTGPATPRSESSSNGDNSLTISNSYAKEILTSHEALLLPYESSLTRGRYCTSAAFLWVGERTRQLDGAHVELLRGLRNPIGIKLSAKTSPQELITLLDILSPDGGIDEAGRITLITRLGAQNVTSALPPLIQAVQASKHHPLWMCDPCHGNTATTTGPGKEKVKTRCVMTMLDEAQQTYSIHRDLGSQLGGLHLEQTGESVAECVEHIGLGGTGDLSLGINYRTLCDPRLSREQALLFVERWVDFVKGEVRGELERTMHEIGIKKREEERYREGVSVEGLSEEAGKMTWRDRDVNTNFTFVEDHPEEMAAFAYQPKLLETVA
ncbi:MAG: hypothetical protein L6R41_004369 [Letrouitia leprolyta]|nr:MAG: hypothetical protein L6R41_004369 [Letrouitia leprolyta]